MSKTQLTLVLPGIAAILTQEINRNVLPESLSRILKKSKFEQKTFSLSHLLFNHFSQKPLIINDLPVVNLSGIQGSFVRADPCYLHADRDKLLLFSQGLELSDDEAEELVQEVQPLLTDLGTGLTKQSNTEWLLNLTHPADVTFSAMEEVEGQAVDPFLPSGKERGEWLRLWNEIQMQLYNADINQRRLAQNKLPVNSLWFWGAGEFEPNSSVWTSARGDSALLEQLTSASNTLKVEVDTQFSVGKHLWLIDPVDTESDWQKQLSLYENTIFKPILKQLSRGQIKKLIIEIPQLGSYKTTSLDYWKFWS